MICSACEFDTDRLTVVEWRSATKDQWPSQDLPSFVMSLMTPPVTRALPADLHGEYTRERALAWISSRDVEGPTLLVIDRRSRRAIGLLVLFETEGPGAQVDVRLGYLLLESAWGQGFASELVAGFVRWCREQGTVRVLWGGVEPGNAASARVLEKAGFRPLGPVSEVAASEQVFELRLGA